MKSFRSLFLHLRAAVPVLAFGCASTLSTGRVAHPQPVSGEPAPALSAASLSGDTTSPSTSSEAHPRTVASTRVTVAPDAVAPDAAAPTTNAPAMAPSPLTPARSPPADETAKRLSALEAQSLAEREVHRLDKLFSHLSLEPAAGASDSYRFAVNGRNPGTVDVSPLGHVVVVDDGTTGFQELDGEDVFSFKDELRRERLKRQGIAAVYGLPEVRAYCGANAPRCVHFVEGSPAKGCVPDDTDKRQCAWSISIGTLQGIGTDFLHVTRFAGFYFREDGGLFVEPIETGEVVRLKEWRCLRKHDFEAEACSKN